MKEVKLKSGISQNKRALEGGEFRGVLARHVVVPSEAFGYEWKGSSHYLALHDIRLQDGELFGDEQAPNHSRDLRGRLTFVPAGYRVWGWSAPAKPDNSFTALYFDPQEMQSSFGSRFRSANLRPQIYFPNVALNATLAKIREALQADTVDALYLETLCVLSALEICRAQDQRAIRALRPAGQLSQHQERRVEEYIQAHLGSNVGLADLAEVAGLSRFHLIRVFKNTTGNTPYQHVLQRRLERAKDLLQSGRMTVEQVALQTGFKSASRFIRAFRIFSGATPGEFKSHRSANATTKQRSVTASQPRRA